MMRIVWWVLIGFTARDAAAHDGHAATLPPNSVGHWLFEPAHGGIVGLVILIAAAGYVVVRWRPTRRATGRGEKS